MTDTAETARTAPRTPPQPGGTRALRTLVVLTLVGLTVQGWLGDEVNLFGAPPNGTPPPAASLNGFVGAVASLHPALFLLWHTVEGVVLVALAVAVIVCAFRCSASTGVRAWSVLGLLTMVSAAVGGYLFVMSGFTDGGASAQMGGSFIGAYASYFLTLYYTRSSVPTARRHRTR